MNSKWPMVPLGEVLAQYKEYIESPEPKIYPKLSVKLYGKGAILDSPTDGTTLKMKRHQIAKSGQVILSEIWGKKGAIGFVPPEGEGALCTSHFFLFDVDSSRIDQKYLQSIFTANYLQDQLDLEAKGTTGYAAVRPKILFGAKIPLPPFDEQRRIVARIEELAARIEEVRELRRRAVEETDLLLYAASRKLRLELIATKTVKEIGDITTVTSGGTPDRSNPQYWDNGTIPWIKTGELLDEPIVECEEKISEAGLANSSAKLFPIDTILIALYGQGQTRGRTGLLKVPATTNQACAAILPKPEIFESSYLQFWLRSLYHEMRKQNRNGAQPNWNGNMIKKIKIALPSIVEQRRIVSHLEALQSKIDALKRHQAETAAELNALLPAVLERAFRGEL